MLQSKLFGKTRKTISGEEESMNARLLQKGGFVSKTMSGVYTFLPLGLRVLSKIENIVREEMNAIGGEEVLMPALQPKENWVKTGRWEGFDALYKVISHFDAEYALGPTHEEIVVPLAQEFIFSYRDLPLYVYQIQTKFRDEARPKSGLLRGREFRMKDLYSFHTGPEDLAEYYAKAKDAYSRVFERVGLKAVITEASGGTFSKYSHEFQVLSETGEDVIFVCGCGFAVNKEISKSEENKCPKCGEKMEEARGIEAGNIFQLNTKYSEPFGLKYKDKKGEEKIVYMGCYGIGTSRLMGVAAEVLNDEGGLVWPEAIAPFKVHLLKLGDVDGDSVYSDLQDEGVEVLYDDRETSPGEKFQDADLIGLPWRAVVSPKTEGKIEIKKRGEKEAKIMSLEEAIALMRNK